VQGWIPSSLSAHNPACNTNQPSCFYTIEGVALEFDNGHERRDVVEAQIYFFTKIDGLQLLGLLEGWLTKRSRQASMASATAKDQAGLKALHAAFSLLVMFAMSFSFWLFAFDCSQLQRCSGEYLRPTYPDQLGLSPTDEAQAPAGLAYCHAAEEDYYC
jgi:hypothetical protein